MNNDQVGHDWFYCNKNVVDQGAKNFFHDGTTVYSYGSHYPIARKLGFKFDDVVLFTIDGSGIINTSSYGSTTAHHVSIVRRAIPNYIDVIFVDNVNAKNKKEHLHNYENNMKLIKGIVLDIAVGRNGSGIQNERVWSVKKVVQQMNKYTKLFKLGKRQIDIEKILDKDAIKKAKVKQELFLKKIIASQKKRTAQIIQENQQKIEDWKNGKRAQVPYAIKECFLRINGDVVETSKGAKIELDHAIKLFSYVKCVNAGKLDFQKKHFGTYTLISVNEKKITIGCHTIKIEEMARINSLIK